MKARICGDTHCGMLTNGVAVSGLLSVGPPMAAPK